MSLFKVSPLQVVSYWNHSLTEFIRMTLVNKIIEVSGVQFSNTSTVHCIVCSPPQVKSPFIKVGSFFNPVWNLPLIRVLRSFKFKMISDNMIRFESIIWLFVFYFSHLFFVPSFLSVPSFGLIDDFL